VKRADVVTAFDSALGLTCGLSSRLRTHRDIRVDLGIHPLDPIEERVDDRNWRALSAANVRSERRCRGVTEISLVVT